MRNWLEAGAKWRCAHCVEPLTFAEIWQDAQSGDTFCAVCWISLTPHLQPVLPPVLCEECGAAVKPGRNQRALSSYWNGVGDWPTLCEFCAEPVSEDEEQDVIERFLKLLEDTHEEG